MLPMLRAMTAFFEAQSVIYAGYSLAGKACVRYSHLGFTGPVHCLFKAPPPPKAHPQKSIHVSHRHELM